MAVLQMQRICICALKKERKRLLEFVQRQGVIEINDVIPEDSVFRKTDISAAKSIFDKNIAASKESLEILDRYVLEKKPFLDMLNGRNQVDVAVYDSFAGKYDSVVKTANRICKLAKMIAESKAEILKLEAQAETLLPWSSLDIPLNFKGTKSTTAFIGALPNEWNLEKIYEQLAEMMPLDVSIVSTSREQTCIFVICGKEQADAVSEVLRGNGFVYPPSTINKAPMEKLEELQEQINVEKVAIIAAEEEIGSYGELREDIRFLEDYDTMRMDKYDVISHLLQSEKVFVMTGYIPQEQSSKLETELNKRFEVVVEFEQPSEKENVPVLLHNNGFCSPLESTVEGFSLPGNGEADPTFVMSLFYYLLFGLMLSDAGYGAIIAVGCGFALLKFKNVLEDSMRRTLKMYLFCGISTVFWGIMFGSYFGDIIDVVSETFFGNKITIPPVWFFPVNEPMRMLVFSMAFGVVHLYAGLAMKAYQSLKGKDYKAFWYDVIFWYALLTSSIILLLSMDMITSILGVSIVIPPMVRNISAVIAIVSTVGITFTNGRESRNPFKRFLKGIYALYGITGYLSDVLSYSRLLALGLATGVIGSVINKMAAMTASGPIGVIPFVLIVILGHAVNIGINALGAYVHTNRLQYVEFFGKFYEGGGSKFDPFHVRTKYYKFKEN